jgi:hypothetical protein
MPTSTKRISGVYTFHVLLYLAMEASTLTVCVGQGHVNVLISGLPSPPCPLSQVWEKRAVRGRGLGVG